MRKWPSSLKTNKLSTKYLITLKLFWAGNIGARIDEIE
jgi:hypothetical protein